jgi:lactoylglutathione lyase
MKYLHTMVRVTNLDDSLDFYCNKLGLKELRRHEVEQGRFTLVFLAAPGDEEAQVELTHNWDPEQYDEGRNFGHLAYVPAADGCRRDHQPAAARRPHGIRTLARQYFYRITAER